MVMHPTAKTHLGSRERWGVGEKGCNKLGRWAGEVV
jgi:hypothetical protein